MNASIKTSLYSLGLLIICACTSIPAEQVNARISEWKGQTIDQLINYWGLPSKQHQVGNKHYAEWINQSSQPGNMAISVGSGHRSHHTGIGIGLTLFDLGGGDDVCSRLVTYNEYGRVTHISWQGTNDYCYQVTPSLTKIRANNTGIKETDKSEP